MKKLCSAMFLMVAVLFGMVADASAQTDLSTTITTISGYWSSALVIGIGILLFVIGRKVVKKI